MTSLIEQYQAYNGSKYAVTDLIEASKDLPVVELEVKYIYANGDITCDDIASLAKSVKRVNDADLDYPIIMSPDGFVLDGKHRLTKALATGANTIKVRRFDEMPPCGFSI